MVLANGENIVAMHTPTQSIIDAWMVPQSTELAINRAHFPPQAMEALVDHELYSRLRELAVQKGRTLIYVAPGGYSSMEPERRLAFWRMNGFRVNRLNHRHEADLSLPYRKPTVPTIVPVNPEVRHG